MSSIFIPDVLLEIELNSTSGMRMFHIVPHCCNGLQIPTAGTQAPKVCPVFKNTWTHKPAPVYMVSLANTPVALLGLLIDKWHPCKNDAIYLVRVTQVMGGLASS